MKKRFLAYSILCVVLSYAYSQDYYEEVNNRICAYQDSISKNNSILANHKLSDKKTNDILRENNEMKDSIIVLLEQKCLYEEKIIADYDYQLGLVDFYWCTDTTVFGSQYIELDKVDEYPQFLIEFYQLVTDLRNINLILVDIEKVIEDVNEGEATATLTPELKGKIILEKTKEKLTEAQNLLKNFKEREVQPYLSPAQVSYYQDFLIAKYNSFIDIIDNKSNN